MNLIEFWSFLKIKNMISAIFSKNNTLLSKLIRWIASEPVSHIAIGLDNRLIFESNLYGTHPKWLSSFLKKNEIVFQIDFIFTLEKEEDIYLKIPQYSDRRYDFGALFYMIYRGILYKLFKIPIPETNLFGKEDQFLCVELAKLIDPSLENLETITPYQLYLKLKKKYG